MSAFDMAVIGAGPAGAATAIAAARRGVRVGVFEKAQPGRDKSCGDGLTPRAVRALGELGVPVDDAHPIAGVRMIAGKQTREVRWPDTESFGSKGAVWRRRNFDAALCDAAAVAGADVRYGSEAMPEFGDDGAAVGVRVNGELHGADLVVLAAGAPGAAARALGAVRDTDEPFALAIRSYAESPRHGDDLLEACLALKDNTGASVPGYGWMFPAGDGTVNIGVGVLSTMRGFKRLNLNHLCDLYRAQVEPHWGIGDYLERPWAWRLPMSAVKRHGPGWVAVGDAAGLVNPMNGEGIDYGLEAGLLVAELFADDPPSTPARYDQEIGARLDRYLETGRRFAMLIGHERLMRAGLRVAVGSDAVAKVTLAVMGNLIDDSSGRADRWALRGAQRLLALADPLLRRTAAARRRR